MKFIHTADLHLGQSRGPNRLPPHVKEALRLAERATLRHVLDHAQREECDAVLIAGDLFHTPTPPAELSSFVRRLFADYPDLQIYITPGNHDPYIPGSPYIEHEWPENVSIFTHPSRHGLLVDKTSTMVWGFAWTSARNVENPFSKGIIPSIVNDQINILMGHGSEINTQPKDWTKYAPFDLSKIDLTGIDYVALGHLHKPQLVKTLDGTTACYPGTLNPSGFSESGPRSFLQINITDHDAHVTICPSPAPRFIRTAIAITPETTLEHILEAFPMPGAIDEPPIIAEVTLLGVAPQSRKYAFPRLLERLSRHFLHLEIIDKSVSTEDLEKLRNSDDQFGKWYSTVQDAIDTAPSESQRNLLQRALEHGVTAAIHR